MHGWFCRNPRRHTHGMQAVKRSRRRGLRLRRSHRRAPRPRSAGTATDLPDTRRARVRSLTVCGCRVRYSVDLAAVAWHSLRLPSRLRHSSVTDLLIHCRYPFPTGTVSCIAVSDGSSPICRSFRQAQIHSSISCSVARRSPALLFPASLDGRCRASRGRRIHHSAHTREGLLSAARRLPRSPGFWH